MKHIHLGKVVGVALMTFAVMVFAAGIASAAPGEGEGGEDRIDEDIKLGLIPTENAMEAMGDARLRLREDSDGMVLRAGANAEGLVPNHTFTLWVGRMLIDTEESDDHGRVAMDEEMNTHIKTLSGSKVTIRFGTDPYGMAVLSGNVS